jgi:septal ring factor EnvC (AmiA/AmiB activator)
MAQGLLNSVQKERDTLKEEISSLRAQLQSASENTDSTATGRLTDVSAAYQYLVASSGLIVFSSWNSNMRHWRSSIMHSKLNTRSYVRNRNWLYHLRPAISGMVHLSLLTVVNRDCHPGLAI